MTALCTDVALTERTAQCSASSTTTSPPSPTGRRSATARARRSRGFLREKAGDAVSRASQARRIAVAAAYGGGGLGLLTAGAFGLIRAEAALARRAIGEPTGTPPEADGVYGRHHGGEPISARRARRLERLRARRRARRTRRPARCWPPAWPSAPTGRSQLAVVAVVGAQSSDLDGADRRGSPRLRPRRRGDHDRRQRRDPPGHARRRPCATSTRPCAGCASWAPRWSSAPAPTSARSSRCPSRCAGSPGARAGARRGADHRGRRGRRPQRLAGRHPRAGVRGLAGRDVRPGRLPPVGGGLRQRRRGAAAVAVRGAGRLVRRRRGAAARPGPRRGRAPGVGGRRRGRRRGRHRGGRRAGGRPRPRPARPLGAAAPPARPAGAEVQAERPDARAATAPDGSRRPDRERRPTRSAGVAVPPRG